ncbi:MFS transporter [Thauera sp. Sel9]|uniref:MFS transporter n=1 Tax=Thauera sp. Sel9 TaxID=2974299 RepID=UPI0021E1816B|nr:MFS transporter [Thauera sp. Sel9]MCV2216740.1 MFS transporter [Thauera sp. Sel9]
MTQMQQPGEHALNMHPLLFEAFACSLAMMSFVAVLGPMARVLGFAPWQAGAVMTAGGLSLALFARLWGVCSDRRGRRRILLLALGGFCVSHLAMSSFAIWTLEQQNQPVSLAFGGLLALRALSGLFYAAVPAIGAALIADHAPAGQRTRLLAGLGAANALGLIAGPGLTALVVGQGLVLSIAASALLPFAALAVMWRWLPRYEIRADAQAAPALLHDRRLHQPMIVAFVAMTCVGMAQVTVGFFAFDRLQLDAAAASRTAGTALTGVGIALALSQLLLRVIKWPAARWIVAGGLLSAAGFASVAWAQSAQALWLGYFVAAFGMGWVFPSVAGLAADAVQPGEHGAAAGAVATAHGWGMIVGPLLGSLLYGMHAGVPYGVMVLTLLVMAISISLNP